jgi:DNA polymerase III delta prime subunit
MSVLFENLDKNNLPHAFLLEGDKNNLLPLVFDFLKFLDIPIKNNPDLYLFDIENFIVANTEDILLVNNYKPILSKKVIILSVNSFTGESQNKLLKTFEDASSDTLFFLIVSNKDILLPTVISRFYFLGKSISSRDGEKTIKDFLGMSLVKRIDFIKEMLGKDEKDEENSLIKREILYFLNDLEVYLEKNRFIENKKGKDIFEQILKIRKSLQFAGAPVKMLLEALALNLPIML